MEKLKRIGGKDLKAVSKIVIVVALLMALIGTPIVVLPYIVTGIFISQDGKLTMDTIGLFISVYSLEATIVLAFIIYVFQKWDADKDHRKRMHFAKTAMGTALESGIRRILLPKYNSISGMASSTIEVFKEYMPELQEMLTGEQYQYLIKVVETIDNDVNDEEKVELTDMGIFIREQFYILSRSKYHEYFKDLNIVSLYNDRLFELLSSLGMVDGKFENMNSLGESKEKIWIECGDSAGYYRIWMKNKLILDGEIGVWEEYDDSIKILNGYESSEEYEGYYKNGFFEGEGCLYGLYGKKLSQGVFRRGELVKGIEYNVLVKKETSKESSLEEGYSNYFQMDKDFFWDSMISPEIKEDGMDNFYIVDLEICENMEDIIKQQKFEIYLQENDPERLERFREYYL